MLCTYNFLEHFRKVKYSHKRFLVKTTLNEKNSSFKLAKKYCFSDSILSCYNIFAKLQRFWYASVHFVNWLLSKIESVPKSTQTEINELWSTEMKNNYSSFLFLGLLKCHYDSLCAGNVLVAIECFSSYSTCALMFFFSFLDLVPWNISKSMRKLTAAWISSLKHFKASEEIESCLNFFVSFFLENEGK